MTWLIAAALGAGAALVQLGAAPALFGEPRAAPVLPLALIAGWGAARGLPEATPAAVLAALNIPAFTLTREDEVEQVTDGALKLAYANEGPVALLISTQLAGWKNEK